MTTVVLNTVTRKVEVFSSARDVQARAEIADHKAAADPHPQYLADAELAEVALSGDAGDLIAGTVPDARMPNWTGYSVASRTALEAANVPAAVVGLRLLGHAAVGDGGGAHYKRVASEPAHPHKIQSADGAWWEELFAVDVTVSIPSDFATLQDAIDRLSKQPVRRGARIILNIESGHAPATGLSIVGGDYSHFRIASTDAEVTVHATFTGQLFYFENCRPPVLAALFNMNSLGSKGYEVNQGCVAFIAPGAGVKNAGSHGCEVRTSNMVAVNTIWTGANATAIRVQRGATADFGGANASNSGTTDRAIYVSRASVLNFSEGTCDNSGGTALLARRSWVNALGALIRNSIGVGVQCDQGGHCIVAESTVTGSGTVDLRVFDGSVINANTHSTYGTTSQAINLLTSAGIIYDSSAAAIDLYYKTNILGTVSQTGGVPTGAVLETGSNANGTYTKFADGTLICRHTMKAEYHDTLRLRANWTFPAAFIAADAYSWTAMKQQRSPANVLEGVGHSAALINASASERAHSATGLTVDVDNSSSPFVSGDFIWMSLTATGRWFA